MQTTELKTEKNTATGIKNNAEDTKNQQINAQLNRLSAQNYLQNLARERPHVGEGLQRTLNSLHANLNKSLVLSDEELKALANKGCQDLPYTNLSCKLIDRDKNLQDTAARLLSTADSFVRAKDSSSNLKKVFQDLPATLREGSDTGNALAKAVTEGLATLGSHKNMGAGLIRDLSVRGIYISADEPGNGEKNAATRVLKSTVSFIRDNSQDILKELKGYAGSAESIVKAEPYASKEESDLQSSQNASLKASAGKDNSTYLDIFKKNSDLQNENIPLSSEPSERIKQIIARAAEKARRSNLIRTESSNKNSANNTSYDNKGSSKLRELASRASSLERQFRSERQKIAQDGKLPDPAPSPDEKTGLSMQSITSQDNLNTLKSNNAAASNISNLNNAQVKISYSAVQSSFFGSLATVPGMDLPLQDFNQDELKAFAAVSEAQALSSKRVISQVLSEQQRLMAEDGANKNVADSTVPASDDQNLNEDETTAAKAVDDTVKVKDGALKDGNTDKIKEDTEINNNAHDPALKKNAISEQKQAFDEQNNTEEDLSIKAGNKAQEAQSADKRAADPEDLQISAENDSAYVSSKVNSAEDSSQDPDQVQKAPPADEKRAADTAFNAFIRDTAFADDVELKNDIPLKGVADKNANDQAAQDTKLSQMAVANAKALDDSRSQNISRQQDEIPDLIQSSTDSASHVKTMVKDEIPDRNKDTLADTDKFREKSFDNIAAGPLPSVASSVTTGGSMPIPEQSMIEGTTADSEGGLFRKIAALFSKEGNDSVKSNTQSIAAAQVSLKAPSMNTPFDVYLKSLNAAAADNSLPESIKKEALELKKKLLSPLSDLTAADSWLSFVTGPMSPQSPRAIALQQWAFLLLCMRFKQLGKSVSGFLKKKSLTALDDILEGLVDKSDESRGKLERLCDETLEQISRLQKKDENAHPLLNRALPLPPAYDGGKEGALLIRRTQEDQKNVWHLTFQFDLEKSGAVEIKAVAAFPEIRISFAADTLAGLKAVQDHSVTLAQTLESLGFEPKASAPRLGRIRPLAGVSDEKHPLDDPATGISLEI